MTGALGYLGEEVVRALHKRNMLVCAVARPGSDVKSIDALVDDIVYWDLSTKTAPVGMPDEIDVVYHIAAATQGSHFEMMMNTVVATDNLLQFLRNKKVKRLVLVSSFSVYKMASLKQGGLLDETCPVEDKFEMRDSYAITKIRQEILTKRVCAELNIPLVVVRPGKIYGPLNYPIPPQLGLRIPGICFLFIGGRSILPLTHVSNCAEAIVLAGIREGVEGEVFNIVDDDLPTQGEFMRLYKRFLGNITRRIWVPYFFFKLFALSYEIASKKTKRNIPPIISRYRADNLWKSLRYTNEKAKRELAWRPEISTKAGVETMLQKHRELTGLN